MEVKYLKKEIQELNRMEHFKMLSDRGKEKLKEYEYLVNLHESKVKELNLAVVSVPEGTVCKKCNGTGELPRRKGDLITRHCDC